VIPTKHHFNDKNIKILSIDFETRHVTTNNRIRNQIFAAGFFSNNEFEEAIHLEDSKFLGDEIKFIKYIVYKIQSFQGIITGWYLANSDLVILDKICKNIGVISPVGFYEVPIEPSNDNDNDDAKVIVKGMEGKKRDRTPFFNQVFSQLIEDYRNNEPDLSLNIIKAFKQLEAAEVDPSLLAYSVVLSKDPDQYQPYTPQHKIGTSMNKEAGGLIQYYKTGQEQDGYKGYSTNYQDLNVDIYKEELWRIVKDILTLQGYDIQKLEDQIFGEREEDTVYDTSLRLTERQQTNHKRSQSNVRRNESLAKYLLSIRIASHHPTLYILNSIRCK